MRPLNGWQPSFSDIRIWTVDCVGHASALLRQCRPHLPNWRFHRLCFLRKQKSAQNLGILFRLSDLQSCERTLTRANNHLVTPHDSIPPNNATIVECEKYDSQQTDRRLFSNGASEVAHVATTAVNLLLCASHFSVHLMCIVRRQQVCGAGSGGDGDGDDVLDWKQKYNRQIISVHGEWWSYMVELLCVDCRAHA